MYMEKSHTYVHRYEMYEFKYLVSQEIEWLATHTHR